MLRKTLSWFANLINDYRLFHDLFISVMLNFANINKSLCQIISKNAIIKFQFFIFADFNHVVA